jgi:hypothetical protein
MTYTILFKRLRLRILSLKGKTVNGVSLFDEDGILYSVSQDAARRLNLLSKDKETSASLSLVAGTASYTISSAIAADVGEINMITIGNTQTYSRSLAKYQDELESRSDAETGSPVAGDPRYWKVFNGVLTFLPTPVTTETATVYYSIRPALGTWITTGANETVPVLDDYIESVVLLAASILYEMAQDFKTSMFYEQKAMNLFNEANASQPSYDGGESVTYHDSIG